MILELFRYGRGPRVWHFLMGLSAWLCAIGWLYFAFISKQFIQRMIEGQAELLDALIGLPLILALTLVIYASVYWAIKLILIIAQPNAFILPPEYKDLPDELAENESENETHR